MDEACPVWSACDPWRAGSVALDLLVAVQGGRAGLDRRRARRLDSLLAAAERGSPLYRERLAVAGGAFERIAPVSKDQLMQRFDDWVCDERLALPALRAFIADPATIGAPFAGEFQVWESSGSSGVPGLFVQDASAMAVYDALEALRPAPLVPERRWWDPFRLAERSAFVGATGGHFASTVSVERLRRLQPWLAGRLRGFSFLQPLPALRAQFEAFAPTLLATYPSAALLLAEEHAAGRLQIAPAEIWTGGEALSEAQRAVITGAFGCPVANSYGASEFLALAAPCRLGALHLNSDWVLLEPTDEGDTLLTNLANHVQPLIRYRLGDRVTLHESPCACGSPLPVIEVQGRIDDSLVLHTAAGRPVRLLPLALITLLEEAGVADFQIVQRGADRLELRVAEGLGARALQQARRALRAHLQARGLAAVHIDAFRGAAQPQGRSGKRPRVVAA